MKKLATISVIFFMTLAMPEAIIAQSNADKSQRKIMRESIEDDKEDQKSYARQQERHEKQINRKERRAEKREARIIRKGNSVVSSRPPDNNEIPGK